MASLSKLTVVEGGTILAEHITQFFDSLSGLEAYDNVHIAGLLKITSGSVYVGRGAGGLTSGDTKFHITGSTDTNITTATNFFKIQDNILLVSSSGDIGFGTLNPQTQLHVTGSISASHLELSGNATIGGNLTIGDETTDYAVVQADLSSSLTPNNDNAFDIGSTSQSWKNIYFKSNLSGSAATTASFGDAIVTDKMYFKDFGGEYISGDGTDLNITSANDINVPADIGLTFGNDGEKIEGNGTRLSIASGDGLVLDGEGDIEINADGGNVDIKDNTAVLLNISSTKVSGSATSTGSFGELKVAGNVGIEGVTADTILDIDSNSVSHIVHIAGNGATQFSGSVDVTGSLNATTVQQGGVDMPDGNAVSGSFAQKVAVSGSLGLVTGVDTGTTVISGSATATASFHRLEVKGNTDLTGNLTLGGNLTIGDADSDSVAVKADLSSSLIPNNDNAFDIGSASKSWKDIYAKGNVSSSVSSTGSFSRIEVAKMLKISASEDTLSETMVLTYHTASGEVFFSSSDAFGGGGLVDIVNDTTPQLGGNLDLNGKNISGSGAVTASGVSVDGKSIGPWTNLADANFLVYSSSIGRWVNATKLDVGIGTNIGHKYRHDQTSTSANWYVSHSLGEQYPNISVYNASNQLVIPTAVTADSDATMTVTFNSPLAGKAYLSTGGSGVLGNSAPVKLNQATAATKWAVTHSLGEASPVVVVYDDKNELMIPQTVKSVGVNHTEIFFDSPVSGSALITLGASLPGVNSSNALKFLRVNSDGDGVEYTQPNSITGSLSLTGNVTGSSTSTGSFGKLVGEGGAITGVTAEWDGTHTGDGTITGDLTVGGTIYETSAERFKTDIEPIGSQLNNVMKLNGKKFYKLNNYSKREVGLIAEEVNEVYPEFVSEDASSINYGKMVTVLVEAVKELNDNLNQAKERIRILETDK